MPKSLANPLNTQTVQHFLPGFSPVQNALTQLAQASGEERGAVFTRREVVEFILDLSGYTTDVPLHHRRLLEPSFGGGEFLLVAVERLFNVYQAQKDSPVDVTADLQDAIRAVELHQDSFVKTRATLLQLLARFGVPSETAQILLSSWLVQGDFLLEDFPFAFSHVVGNPPYVRHELIPDELMTEYRKRFQTIFDRADLYIPFIEKARLLLEPRGTLGMICSDRWMKNHYGGPLRKLIADHFSLKYYVDMVDTPAFHAEVSAYPAITIIAKDKAGKTRLAQRPDIEESALKKLASDMTSRPKLANNSILEITHIAQGSDPWVLESFDELALIRHIESRFPTLEEAGCKVGIGVATGADAVFIGLFKVSFIRITTYIISSQTPGISKPCSLSSYPGLLISLSPSIRQKCEAAICDSKRSTCAVFGFLVGTGYQTRSKKSYFMQANPLLPPKVSTLLGSYMA